MLWVSLVMAFWGQSSTAQLPSVPSQFDASTNDSNLIRCSWQSASAAFYYELWRSTNNALTNATLISSNLTATTSYTDTVWPPGVKFYYWVRAGNGNGLSEFAGPAIGIRQPPKEGQPYWTTSGVGGGFLSIRSDAHLISGSYNYSPGGARMDGLLGFGHGPRAIVDLDDNVTAVGGWVMGRFSRSGAEMWRKEFPGKYISAIAMGLYDSAYCVLSNSFLMSITRFGEVGWSRQLTNPAVSAPIVLQDGSIVIATSASVDRLTPSGEIMWTTPLASTPPIDPNNRGNSSFLGASTFPAQLVPTRFGLLYLVTPTDLWGITSTGSVLWNRSLGSNGQLHGPTACVADDGRLLVLRPGAVWIVTPDRTGELLLGPTNSNNKIVAFCPLQGTKVWALIAMGGSPAPLKFHAALFDYQVSSTRGPVTYYDEIISLSGPSETSEPAACLTGKDGTIYVHHQSGRLTAFRNSIPLAKSGWSETGGNRRGTQYVPGDVSLKVDKDPTRSSTVEMTFTGTPGQPVQVLQTDNIGDWHKATTLTVTNVGARIELPPSEKQTFFRAIVD